jgi:transcriptional regulator with XRE-family HTH domain
MAKGDRSLVVEADRKRRIRGRAFALGLAVVRAARGGVQAFEALQAGVSLRTWRRWERAETQASVTRLEAVAERWRVRVDDLTVQPTRERLAVLRLEQDLQRLVDEHEMERVRAAAEVVGIIVRT